MASATPTLTWEQYQQLPPDKRSRPLTPAEYSALTSSQRQAGGLEDADEGAPINFSGPVFPNPNHIRPHLDTDPTMPVTRLPNGVSFNNSNSSGQPPMDISNPARAQIIPAAAQTTGAPIPPDTLPADFNGFDKAPDTLPANFSQWDADKGQKPQPGMLDKELPLDSYTNATLSGLQSIGRGLRDAGKGAYQTMLAPPKDKTELGISALGPPAVALYRTLRGLGHTAADATQLVGAIHDINNSADPAGSYAKAAQETAGQGAGQAILALGTEGAARVAPAIADAASAAAGTLKPALSKVGSAATAVGESLDPDLVGLVSPRAAHALRLSAKAGRIATKLGAEAEVPAELDATGENTPFAGGTDEPPAPKNARVLDATGENKPFAGGMDEAPAVRPVPRKAPVKRTVVVDPTTGRPEFSDVVAAPPAAATPVQPAPVAQTPKATVIDLQQQIKDALGGKTSREIAGLPPLEKNVSLNNQRPQTNLAQQIKDAAEPATKQTPKAPLTDLQGQIKAAAQPPLPEDFTATPDSSLLKGYKYDPAAKRFSVILNDGQGARTGVPDFVHGEVSPEQVEAFKNSDSQGSAWTKKIRQGAGTVQVEKNGVPTKPIGARKVVVDPATGRPEFSDVVDAKQNAAKVTAPAAGSDDLTLVLQQMLDAAKAAKAAKTPGSAGSTLNRLIKGEAGQAGLPGSVTDADEGISEIQNRPVLSTKTGEVPARGFLNKVGADETSVLKTKGDADSVFYHRQQIAKNGTPSVELHLDEGNNVIGAQGRHRAVAAIQQGGPNAKVNVTIYKYPY